MGTPNPITSTKNTTHDLGCRVHHHKSSALSANKKHVWRSAIPRTTSPHAVEFIDYHQYLRQLKVA
ncbi:MAG: hypothetical protein DWI30_08260 [Chloroflexi bacterium]|nr:MAG: hypothetical protein DWI30_08260 [Chloroflexota bacterium]